MTDRVAPMHCPYCAEEDIRPHEQAAGGGGSTWECRSCARVFTVKFVGLLARKAVER